MLNFIPVKGSPQSAPSSTIHSKADLMDSLTSVK